MKCLLHVQQFQNHNLRMAGKPLTSQGQHVRVSLITETGNRFADSVVLSFLPGLFSSAVQYKEQAFCSLQS